MRRRRPGDQEGIETEASVGAVEAGLHQVGEVGAGVVLGGGLLDEDAEGAFLFSLRNVRRACGEEVKSDFSAEVEYCCYRPGLGEDLRWPADESGEFV